MKTVLLSCLMFLFASLAMGSDKRAVMNAAQQKLVASGIVKKAKQKGSQYIDFTLPDAQGKQIKISTLLQKGPVILSFYRGGWCPYCNRQLAEYQTKLSEIQRAGGQLVAVSPEKPSSAQDTVTKNELEFIVLSDNHNAVARKYGLVFKVEEALKSVYLEMGLDLEKSQDNDSWELPLPATYVISKTGEIVYSFVEADYKNRASVSELIQSLKALK